MVRASSRSPRVLVRWPNSRINLLLSPSAPYTPCSISICFVKATRSLSRRSFRSRAWLPSRLPRTSSAAPRPTVRHATHSDPQRTGTGTANDLPLDVHPANVFPQNGRTAVIDLAYCGIGPVGADAGVLASDAIADELIKPEEADRLVNAVWDGYQQGVNDEHLAAEAAGVYALGTALRYAWLPAWLAGSYGPPMPDTRRPFVAAAHAAFLKRAVRYL
jgi:Ser/Thr protein kinase RdoA (MazF antagonist)